MQPHEPLLQTTLRELAEWVTERGFAAYHARQTLSWVFDRRADQFQGMTDLPRGLRELLQDHWQVFTTRKAHVATAPDGTKKALLQAPDNNLIECVLMSEHTRRTACISTQVGCGMGCVFCASGLGGLVRNLTKSEILEQVLYLRNLLPITDRLSHIVVMGMGESLANLDALIPALDWICSQEGLGLSARRVTISTVGLPEKMRELAALDRRYHLAVSLHAATEDLRDRLVPINHKVGLDRVVEAADAYFQKTGRQVTFEYVLLGGVNDRLEDAKALALLLKARKAHVNLIPFNPVEGLEFKRPAPADIDRFVAILTRDAVSATIRKTKGRPIDAACGQLRRRIEVTPLLIR